MTNLSTGFLSRMFSANTGRDRNQPKHVLDSLEEVRVFPANGENEAVRVNVTKT